MYSWDWTVSDKNLLWKKLVKQLSKKIIYKTKILYSGKILNFTGLLLVLCAGSQAGFYGMQYCL